MNQKQKLQDGEFVKVIKIERNQLLSQLYKFSDDGFLIDAKFYALVLDKI
jgi:hypothetical protein